MGPLPVSSLWWITGLSLALAGHVAISAPISGAEVSMVRPKLRVSLSLERTWTANGSRSPEENFCSVTQETGKLVLAAQLSN